MDQEKEKRRGGAGLGGCAWEKTGYSVNRRFTKLSLPDAGPSQYAQYALLPKSLWAKSPSTWCKTIMKRPTKGEDRVARESQPSPLPQ